MQSSCRCRVRRASICLLTIAGCLSIASIACSQETAAKAVAISPDASFDVAAIHVENTIDSGRSHIISAASDGNFRAINVHVLDLIRYAYGIPESRIEGGPAWIRSTRFDIEAKSDPASDQMLSKLPSGEARKIKQKMLQNLLENRFALKTHEDARVRPVYVLVVAKGGPKFSPSTVNGTSVNTGNNRIDVRGSDHTVSLLAEELSKSLDRIVLDQTGLDGRYELTLHWNGDMSGSSPRRGNPDAENSEPAIFTAIQEQLGLKLKSEKRPVPVLVIDQLNAPSEN